MQDPTVPPQTKFIRLPHPSNGAEELTPAMAIIHGLAYNAAEGPQGPHSPPRILSAKKWGKLMGPAECKAAGLAGWSLTYQSKVKSALRAAGLLDEHNGEYGVSMTKRFFKLPIPVLAHPSLTPSLVVHWAKALFSTWNKTSNCVPAWCGPNHAGPFSRSDKNHARTFVKLGLATECSGCYSLTSLMTATNGFPGLLTGNLFECQQWWSQIDDPASIRNLLRQRDAVAQNYRERFAQNRSRWVELNKKPHNQWNPVELDVYEEARKRDAALWREFNAEMSRIALAARSKRALVILGLEINDTWCRCRLDPLPALLALPDTDDVAHDPNRKQLLEAGRRQIEAITGESL